MKAKRQARKNDDNTDTGILPSHADSLYEEICIHARALIRNDKTRQRPNEIRARTKM